MSDMNTDTLLIELGTEELPPKALKTLGLAFADGIVAGLAQRELGHGAMRWFASPRRLAVLIEDVCLRGADKTLELLGPPADRAKDADGNWTPAAAGFAKKQGVEPEALITLDTPKGQRLGLMKEEPGLETSACLNAIIQESIGNLPIPRRMRWGASRDEFVRPVHWVVALLGEAWDHGEVLGIATGNRTYGHRFHAPEAIALKHPRDYEQALHNAKVIASFEERQQAIREKVDATAKTLGATAVIEQDLLDEVTGLVEWPVALAGSFDEAFLSVPQEALISSMKEHQKYFHVVDAQGKLKPHFITLANIESTDPAQVIAGNERVIRPRLADAAFFFSTDQKTSLEERAKSLSNIVFQQSLGTLADKTARVAALCAELAPLLGADVEQAKRAAQLSKADLSTEMVLEFSDMQGIAGAYYAQNDGETPEVAAAIAQQYWPKFAGDRLPEAPVASTLALADRLDTLVGIFGIGQPPSGSKDPFALRRASLAVLRILIEKGYPLDLRDCLNLAVNHYPAGVIAADTAEQVREYMIERLRAWLDDQAIAVEVYKAVAAKDISVPLDFQQRALAVHAFAQLPEAQALAAANKRVGNILSKLEGGHSFGDVSTNLLQEPQEKALYDQLESLSVISQSHLEQGEYSEALSSLAALREPVDAFFDGVMVNADDESLRNNRLNLLKSLHERFLGVADISQLVVSK